MKEMTNAKEVRDAEIASLVENEVRKRLTWRLIILAISPLPLVLLLIYFLYCYIQIQCLPVDYLLKHNADVERRLRVIEQSNNPNNRTISRMTPTAT